MRLCFSILALVAATSACSSKTNSTAPTTTSKDGGTKKAATGAPKASTTKAPSSVPKPTTKTSTTVTSATSQSVTTEETCTPDDEGLAICADSYVVFCAGGKIYALDCSVAFDGATCGELDETVDCVVAE